MTANSKHGFFDLDFGKAFSGFTVPGFDVESMVAAQRRNLEALTQANQLAVEGVQAVARRQVEIARQAVDEAQAALRELTLPAAPEDRLAKNAELAKQAFDKSVAHARERAELVGKANREAFGVIQKRVAESLDEIRDYARQHTR